MNFSTTTSLYLVRLKIFESKELLRRLLHQMQGKWGSGNFITVSRVNSRLITHPRIQRWIWNLQLPTVQLSSNKFINGLLGDNAWPGLTVKYFFYISNIGLKYVSCTWILDVDPEFLNCSCICTHWQKALIRSASISECWFKSFFRFT